MQNNRIKRVLAWLLAVSITLSALPVTSSAAETDVYCQTEAHMHEAVCFNEQGVLSCLMAEHSHSADCYEIPESTQTETEPEPETAETETEPEGEPLSLMDQLMTAADLQILWALLVAEGNPVDSLSLGEISAVKDYTQQLYDALEEPAVGEQNCYDLIMDTLNSRLGEQKTDLADDSGNIYISSEADLTPYIFTDSGGTTYYKIDTNTNLQLQNDVTLKYRLDIRNGAVLTVDLNGHVLYAPDGQWFAFLDTCDYSTLVIKDSQPGQPHYGVQQNGKWVYYTSPAGLQNYTTVMGGIITGRGSESLWGGAICMNYNSYLRIEGGTITNFTAAQGGAIRNSGEVYMFGGAICGNVSKGNGGAVHNSGYFQMSGGAICHNTASNVGGGIYNDGILVTTSGTIEHNQAQSSGNGDAGGGGGVYTSGSFTMNGANIMNNAAYNGGGVTVAGGTFVQNNGGISDNTATADGGGIYQFNSRDVSTVLNGGWISNNTGAWGGGIHVANGTFTVSGVALISGNAGSANGGGICSKNATLHITGGDISWNRTNGKGGGVFVESGDLNLTGGSIGSNTANSGGGIYNQGPVAMSGDAAITENHSTGYGGGIYSVANFTMTGGTISNNRAGSETGTDAVDGFPTYSSNWGGGVYTQNSGVKFTMDGGSITGNTAASGGGVGVWDGATFVMNGGTIGSNNAYGIGGPGNGGAAYVNAATFELNGGTIENNWARRYGGAINLNAGGKMKFNGSTGECIIQNNSANNGGGISQEQGQCEISITSDNIIIRNNIARDDNRPSEEHLKTDGCGGGFFIEMGKFTMTAGTISNNSAMMGGGVALRVQRVDGNIDVDITGGTISANTAVESGGGMDIYGGYNAANAQNRVAVNLLGGIITGNRSTAGTGGGIDIWTDATHTTGNMYIGEAGTAGPVITDNHASTNGGAIRMRSGQVYLHSGILSNNHAGQYGGGITVNGGDFEMTGGMIGGTVDGSANTAGNGGGGIALRVQEFASDITVKMTGGSIVGNSAVNTGGGMDIYADFERTDGSKNNVTVDLLGGTFENNASTEGTGGGIDIDVAEANSTAVLNIGQADGPGPQFINNRAAANGGSIRMHNGNIHLYSGTITNNTAKLNGGAFSINGGNFTMSGGTVSENEVTDGYGGAIALNNGIVLISGGAVTKNTAYNHGGGVVVSNGEIIMTGGVVSDNLAKMGDGGGLYITSNGASQVSVKIFSGEISGNQAPNGSGGGLAVNGGKNETEIFVQVGLNLLHTFADDAVTLIPILHNRDGKAGNEFSHEYCPLIQGNSSLVSGGGIFITGGTKTNLNIYCLEELANTTSQDADHTGVLSQFMMVEGGKVIISSSRTEEDGEIDKESSGFGNTTVLSSVHVYAGELYLYGDMENPAFVDALTVDFRNPTDKFEDYRNSDKVLKLTYNENYTDANGIPESTMKAYDIAKGSTVTIAELLFQHPGHTIKGWNTKPDGSGVNYAVGDEYLFIKDASEKDEYELKDGQQYQIDDLNLYAVWEVNLYMVEYHHGIPAGEPYSGNMDGEYIYTYDQYANLELNRFVYPGHVFQHWIYTDDDGNTVTLSDGQAVKNLTNVRGGTVHLQAVWEDCSHSFVYAANDATLTKTCALCTKSASVTIQAENAVYDGKMHKYTVVYSDKAFFEPEILCSAVKFGKQEAPETMYVDAGVYTVIARAADSVEQATLVYHIDKAQQKAPESLPAYDTPKGDDFSVKIHQKTDEMESAESGALIEYTLRYSKNDGTSVDLGWKSDSSGADVIFTLPEAFTIYSVYSRYPETDNYYASQEKIAMSSFFFEGGITVLITPTEGITYTAVNNANSMDIVPSLEPGYYLTEDEFYITVQSGNDGGYIAINGATSGKIQANGEQKFQITAPKTPQEEVEICLELGYAKKMLTVDSRIAPNQVFGTVSGTEATISQDSAYTVYFEVSGYDDDVYGDVGLTFDRAVPVGTKLILLDKAHATYWSYAVADANVTTVALQNFVRMGGSDPFSPSGKDWKLQIVVDFSQADSWHTGSLNTKLSMEQLDSVSENIPEVDNPGVTANLIATSFGLDKEVISETTQILHYSFTGMQVNASRWDHRELALILRPTTALPADAVISVTHNGSNVARCPVQIKTGDTSQTAFLIPLDGFEGTVTLVLETADAKERTYSLSAQLVAAHSIAEDASANGTVLASLDEITFSVRTPSVSIRATESNDQHLFNAGSLVEWNIQIQPDVLPAGYDVVIAQEQKLDGESNYSFAGVYYEATGTGANRTLRILAPAAAGNYRIRFYIETPNGTNVMETVYYFIVQ